MAIAHYLAMTAAEIASVSPLPPKIAWMACHFSPYSTGVSNCPDSLPAGSLLILNDRTPIHGHDPEAIALQLAKRAEALDCRGVLLDFQRPGEAETAALAKHLARTLPCPVAVSDLYAGELDCPVFLSAPPPHMSLADCLVPWQGREVWLETALNRELVTLTPAGAAFASLPRPEPFAEGFSDETVHCHYRAAVSDIEARFTLWRTREDLDALLAEAEKQGVTTAVGLYQELGGRRPEDQKEAFPAGESGPA